MWSEREVKNAKWTDRSMQVRMKSETQSYGCEIEMYVKEKDKCEMFLKNVKAKCESEMQEYVKIKYKNDQFWWLR